MNYYCTMITKTYELKQSTKTVYTLISEEQKQLTQEQYNNMTSADTCSFFRRLGGSETVTRGYTQRGYNVVELTSKSPDRLIKKIRTFNFD
jgi:hypothetical protein